MRGLIFSQPSRIEVSRTIPHHLIRHHVREPTQPDECCLDQGLLSCRSSRPCGCLLRLQCIGALSWLRLGKE